MTYDFKSLSSADFEELTRDLLQAELGFRLESFKAGKDGGIDLRHSKDEGNTLIVQCKHYSDFTTLFQTLKREAVKVKKLNPDRYILSTSVGCNPQQNCRPIIPLFIVIRLFIFERILWTGTSRVISLG